MEKIIWLNGNFVLDEQIYFFEQQKIGEEFKYRKLSPMFAFEYWEVYALPMSDGIFYAIVGLHGGERFFYATNSSVSTVIKNFYSAGRDLICQKHSYRGLQIYQPVGGVLKDIVNSLKDNSSMYVTSAILVGNVLTVCLQAPRFCCERKFFLQTENGYEEINADEVQEKKKNAVRLLHSDFV